ncbi:MAG: hypothetical protein K5778_04385 [Bacteroidaceae bacterium]|nr:hypothetical protein [Bacteroidaceae bacterium]
MRTKAFISFLCILLAVLTGCGERARVSARLDALDSLLSLPPSIAEPSADFDSILTQLDTLMYDVVGDDALEARWNLLYAMTEDKADRPLLFDTHVRPAYDYYRDATQDGTRGDSTLLHRFAQSCFYLGVHYYHSDSTALMEQMMQKSADVAKSCGDHYTAYLALNYLSWQIRLDSPAEAIRMAEEALREFNLSSHQNVYNEICMLLNAGGVWIHASDKSRALEHYEKALNCSLATPDSLFYGYILASMASYYDLTGNPQTALSYMNEATRHLLETDNSWNLIFSQIYLHNDILDKAEVLLTRSNPLSSIEKFHWLKFMQMVKIRQHDEEGSLQLNDSLSFYSNRSYLDALAQKNAYFQENLNKEKLLHLHQQRTERMKMIYVVSVGVIFLIVTLILLWLRYRHRAKMLEAAHLKRQAELETHQQKLINRKNLEKISLLKRQLERQSSIMEHFKAVDDTGSRMMHMSNDDWQNLEVTLDDTYQQFVTRLRQQFPKMNEDGIRLCMLGKLGLTTRQISNIFSISPLSVTKRKQRLRKDYLSVIEDGKTFDEIIENM